MDETYSPNMLADLENFASVGLSKIRDTFQVIPGQRTTTMSPVSSRYGGSQPSDDRKENGIIQASWLFVANSPDLVIQKINGVLAIAEDRAAPGSAYVEWRPDGATRSAFYELRGPSTWTPQYKWQQAHIGQVQVDMQWPVAPLAEDLRLSWWDDFRGRSGLTGDAAQVENGWLHTGVWTWATANKNDLRLPTTGVSGQQAVVYNDDRLPVNDMEVTVRGAQISGTVNAAGGTIEAGIKYDPADGQYVYAQLTTGGALQLMYYNGSTSTQKAVSTTTFTPTLNVDYWVRCWSEGDWILASLYSTSAPPGPNVSPVLSCAVSDANSFNMGATRKGRPVINVSAPTASVNKSIRDVYVNSYAYRLVVHPQEYKINIPGTAPAKVDMEVAASPSVTTPASFMLVSWRPDRTGTLSAGAAGTNAQYTLAITGSPTGGTFQIRFDTSGLTAAIPFNATAAQVKLNLEAVSTLHKNDLTVTGGPLPGSSMTITFAGPTVSETPLVAPVITGSALTGGTTPTATITTVNAGTSAAAIRHVVIDDPPHATAGTRPPSSTTDGTKTLARNTAVLWNSNASGLVVDSSARWNIDPSIFDAEPFTDDALIQIWARLRWSTTPAQWSIVLSTFQTVPEWGRRYSIEYGSTGFILPNATLVGASFFRHALLGTVVWQPNSNAPMVLDINVKGSAAATGDFLWIDRVYMVPAKTSWSSPTNKPLDTNYPSFLPWVTGTGSPRRIVRHDLSAEIAPIVQSALPVNSAAGLGGAPFEPDPGDTRILVCPTTFPPLDPVSTQTADENLFQQDSVSFGVTPRYQLSPA
jgi:hypothetical protein